MGAEGATLPMKYSIFAVQDHYPDRERSIARYYEEMLAQCVLAEELGYDTFFVAEHHFHPYGVFPNPAVALAAAAERTKRIRLGTAVSVLPFRNPLLVAEDYAMLDQLSGGRVVLGVGSGYLAHEFEALRIDPKEKRERFDEALDILRRALAGEAVTVDGRFHRFEGVAINVPAAQRPTPPIYVAVLRKEAIYHVGRQGNPVMNIPYASVDRFEEIEPMVGEYFRGRAESGRAGDADDLLLAFHAHVAESDAAARRDAAEAFDLYVATRLYAKRQVYDDIIESGLALFGSVETVVDKLEKLHRMGLRHVLLLQNFGLLDHDIVCRSMTRIAREVMPALAARVAADPSPRGAAVSG